MKLLNVLISTMLLFTPFSALPQVDKCLKEYIQDELEPNDTLKEANKTCDISPTNTLLMWGELRGFDVDCFEISNPENVPTASLLIQSGAYALPLGSSGTPMQVGFSSKVELYDKQRMLTYSYATTKLTLLISSMPLPKELFYLCNSISAPNPDPKGPYYWKLGKLGDD
jgi:hypothetical protein